MISIYDFCNCRSYLYKFSHSKHFNRMQTRSTCTILILRLCLKRPKNSNCLSIDCTMYTLHKPLFLKVKLEKLAIYIFYINR